MKTHYEYPELTIIIPARNEAENLAILLPRLRKVLLTIKLSADIIVVDELPDVETRSIIEKNCCKLLSPRSRGYGAAIIAGIKYAKSEFIITMDADLSHSPKFLLDLWREKQSADVVIASRYINGGRTKMPFSRLLLSKTLNLVFSRGLDLGIRDMSSGFRLFKSKVIKNLQLVSENFDIQQEILVKVLTEGYLIREIPFTYEPRQHGSSNARVFKFGLAYLRTFAHLWKLRNSIYSADYDSRAYDSWVIIQRYWQRRRYDHIIKLSQGYNQIIDIGCGSSRILEGLPSGSVGLDIQARKLRFARNYKPDLVQGSANSLPLRNESFTCVICSQVIEHISSKNTLEELDRILMPGGKLILGTPDYSKWQWRLIEWFYGKLLPQAYADEHITHYSFNQLIREYGEERGYNLKAKKYILQGELILAMIKPDNNFTSTKQY